MSEELIEVPDLVLNKINEYIILIKQREEQIKLLQRIEIENRRRDELIAKLQQDMADTVLTYAKYHIPTIGWYQYHFHDAVNQRTVGKYNTFGNFVYTDF